ncbi:plant basic secretory protein [Aspergillus welwitschiae]|uniref:Plant basic secretory protein n=1 Tax=Aspergillus welwitschiae TaxID=1341132 RepID=A0A3F3QHM2_9EURO|nr:plant basic secretory protein [Aspergillus welwitschiae]RDH38637.1 plant basic secretory protein [Aspergillus welwitschiae]
MPQAFNLAISDDIPQPTLRLQINDLRHPASKAFLTLLPDLNSTLTTALSTIIQHLYTPPSHPHHDQQTPTFTPSPPPTRSVTLFLRAIDGVAYTTGTELDNDHKEIHLSLSYIRTITTNSNPNPTAELTGVLTHELVHCYQHTAPPDSTTTPPPPGGLIEGIADFVRLKAGLEPPHWKRPASAKERASKWDQGYQHTAYFLAWLEDVKIGRGAVGMLNDRLLRVGYGNGFWEGLFGMGVLELWEEYGAWLDRGGVGDGTTGGCWEDEIVDRV